MKLIFIFLLVFQIYTIYSQCDLMTVYPSSLTFTEVGESSTLYFDTSFNCDFTLRMSEHISCRIQDGQILVTYTKPPTTNLMSKIEFVNSSQNVFLEVPITTPLIAGEIRASITTVYPNNSPGTFSNIAVAMGGNGEYIYFWEQSPAGKNLWTIIPGTQSTTYSCPKLTTSTSFRRVVKSGVQTAYSNVITINVNTEPSNKNNFIKTRNMLTNSGTSYIDEFEYFDGLGRSVESVYGDIVHFREYDG